MSDEQTERDWQAELMTRAGDIMIELATRLRKGADLEWTTKELALLLQELGLVLSDLVIETTERNKPQ